jgi:hypothetical protein
MASVPLSPDAARDLLLQIRKDRPAAERALAALTPEAQAALICDAPLNRRAEILGLVPEPEAVIPLLPEAELCFTVKAIGLADAPWILEYTTPDQVTASLDLDVWNGYEPDLQTLGEWIDALASTPQEAFLRSVDAIDPELLVLWLRSRIEVEQKPAGDEGWTPPEATQTLEGQFYFRPIHEGDDIAPIVTLLRGLFESSYWTYFRLLQGVVWELDSDLEEWALRWRTGRLQDLGFPPWDEAMRIYRFLAPEERALLPESERPLDIEEWHLPIWIPELPAVRGTEQRVFEAIARLETEERRSAFYAFIAVANKVAVADRMALGDADSTPHAIQKAAAIMSAGLAHVAEENGLDDLDVLRHVSLERLFAVGANLDPAGARP